ncbi:Vitamin B12 ABC transporter, B12-binding component BtuF [Pseudoalteromonas luteoviolacea B = ATCC 29581]|nr:Vitamin B12 ABC transporter, B12-binding component BtuF [Pseudoalteromonas luteoviolacea B = ATCC 29581]
MKGISYCLMLLCLFSAFVQAKPKLDTPIKNAQRIVALAPHIVENLFVIGAGDRIVGTVDYADYPRAARDIPRIGGYHGIVLEKLLALEPDVVIAWQTGNKKDDLAKIAALGIPVVYSHAEHIRDVATELRRFGELTGLAAQAEYAALEFERRFAKIHTRYQNSTSLRVFYQLWPEPMMSINKDTWIHQLLELCHVENVFAEASNDYPQLSLENVLHSKPDVIVAPIEKTKQHVTFIDWQTWPEIAAGKYNQVIQVDADLLHRYSTRVLAGVEDLCAKLDTSRRFYQQRKQHDHVE